MKLIVNGKCQVPHVACGWYNFAAKKLLSMKESYEYVVLKEMPNEVIAHILVAAKCSELQY